jgi:hypothetical protein
MKKKPRTEHRNLLFFCELTGTRHAITPGQWIRDAVCLFVFFPGFSVFLVFTKILPVFCRESKYEDSEEEELTDESDEDERKSKKKKKKQKDKKKKQQAERKDSTKQDSKGNAFVVRCLPAGCRVSFCFLFIVLLFVYRFASVERWCLGIDLNTKAEQRDVKSSGQVVMDVDMMTVVESQRKAKVPLFLLTSAAPFSFFLISFFFPFFLSL